MFLCFLLFIQGNCKLNEFHNWNITAVRTGQQCNVAVGVVHIAVKWKLLQSTLEGCRKKIINKSPQ